MKPKPKAVAHTPWKLSDCLIIDAKGNVMFDIGKTPWMFGEVRERVQLVLLCVNSHAALVDALSHLLKEMEFAFDDVPPGVDAWMAIARTALKAAVNPESTKEQTL